MRRHLRLLKPVPPAPWRPAKVVELEVRRQARLEAARQQPQPPKAA
jgi:hypothetical protein